MKKGVFIFAIGLIVLAVVFWTVFYTNEARTAATIVSFDECAAHGYPIMESYPRQCRTPDGRTFTEVIILPGNDGGQNEESMVRNVNVLENATVNSPLTITGEAKGPWYFEASFPIRILDGNGNELGVVPAQAQGEWMTENFVPFKAVLTFKKPLTQKGTLVLEKDNPSGLPENGRSIKIPVVFTE